MAVKRHHDRGSFSKGKCLVGAGLTALGFSSLSSWWEAWWLTGSHSAREGAGGSASGLAGIRKRQ